MMSSRIAVIGGGLSGLAAAHRLLEIAREQSRSLDLTLFEASDRIGGVFGTKQIDGYTVETGADSFITNKPWAISLCKRLGLEDRLISMDPRFRRALVLHKGKPVPTPVGFNLMAPSKIWPMVKTPLLSPWGKLRMGMEYFLPRKSVDDESLASFVRRRFGNESLERIVQPMIGGIYTSDPEKLSLKATLPRFIDMEQEHGSVIRGLRKQSENNSQQESTSGARYGLFASLNDGMSELLVALKNKIETQATLRQSTAVKKVSLFEDHVMIQTEEGEERFESVVMATPAYMTGELLNSSDKHLAKILKEIEYASTAIVVSGHKLANITHPMDASGLVIPAIENRKILAVSCTSRKYAGRAPDGCIQLRTFVGGAMQPELLQHSDDDLIAIVRDELREIFGVQGEPDFAIVARWNKAMPQYHIGHLERVAIIESLAEQHPRLAIAGNAYHGVGLPDVIHSGEKAAEKLLINRVTTSSITIPEI